MTKDRDSLTMPNVAEAENEMREIMEREGRAPTAKEVRDIFFKHGVFLNTSQNN